MIKIGILGAGNIGRVHARAYEQLTNARVVAVADIVFERAESVATLLHARAYSRWRDFFADPDLDVVDICLPTHLHAKGVIGAAQAGKHILCEKPITLSLRQADRMLEAVDKAGVKAMVAQVIRFWPHYLAIKGMLEQGKLGSPIMAQAARLGSPPTWSGWYADPRLSGGALFDLHIHDLDWMYYLFGKPQRVCSIGSQSSSGGWDEIVTSLQWPGRSAVVEASWMMPNSFPFTMVFRLLGDAGYAEYRYGGGQSDPQGMATKHSLGFYAPDQPPEFVRCSDEDPYLAEIRYFVDCLDAGEAPAIATLVEARAVLEVALAARRSLQTGRVVAV